MTSLDVSIHLRTCVPCARLAKQDAEKQGRPKVTVVGVWQKSREFVHSFHDEISGPQRPQLAFREVVVLLVTAILLVVYFYFGKASYFTERIRPGLLESGAFTGKDPMWFGLSSYVYWAAASLFLRFVIPLAVIVVVFRESPTHWGFGLGSLRHAWLYLSLFAAMVPILTLASLDPAFQDKYPFYKAASDGGQVFWLYEVCYGLQFLALESFFRGFLLFGLYQRFGHYAVFIMVVPYCMVHFGKPMPETLGAIAAGIILGTLALKSGSIYLGALLHWGVGLTMDLLASPNIKF